MVYKSPIRIKIQTVMVLLIDITSCANSFSLVILLGKEFY